MISELRGQAFVHLWNFVYDRQPSFGGGYDSPRLFILLCFEVAVTACFTLTSLMSTYCHGINLCVLINFCKVYHSNYFSKIYMMLEASHI